MINTVEKIYEIIPTVKHNGYKVTYVNSNRIKLVPLDEANTDYQAIQEWIADGGTVIDNGGGE
jgi:hypothetical protein